MPYSAVTNSFVSPSPRPPAERRTVSEEAISLLCAAVEFKNRTGSAPTASTMESFVASVKDFMPPGITPTQIWNKIRNIRSRFGKEKPSSVPKHALVRQLVAMVWPTGESSQVDPVKTINDVCDNAFDEAELGAILPFVRVAMEMSCRKKKLVTYAPSLENVVRANGLSKMQELDLKLKEQHCLETKLLAERSLVKDLLMKKLVPDPTLGS